MLIHHATKANPTSTDLLTLISCGGAFPYNEFSELTVFRNFCIEDIPWPLVSAWVDNITNHDKTKTSENEIPSWTNCLK